MNQSYDSLLISNEHSRVQSESAEEFLNRMKTLYRFDRPFTRENERRRHERYSITMPVRVQVVNKVPVPGQIQWQGITRDISESGAGFVLNSPVACDHLKLEFEPCDGRSHCQIAKMIYCIEDGFYFRIGCEFVDHLVGRGPKGTTAR